MGIETLPDRWGDVPLWKRTDLALYRDEEVKLRNATRWDRGVKSAMQLWWDIVALERPLTEQVCFWGEGGENFCVFAVSTSETLALAVC